MFRCMAWQLFSILNRLIFYLTDFARVAILGLCPTSWLEKKSVKGEIVLITGGASGFGRELAKRFATLGARVVIWDINARGNRETADMIRQNGGEIVDYVCDVTDVKRVKSVAERVKKEIGEVNILINNAGKFAIESFLNRDDEDIQKIIDLNLTSNFWTCKAFLPDMMKKNRGQVVFVSSAAGLFAIAGVVDYVATKAGVVAMADAVGMELIKERKEMVKTTVLCPSFTDTGFLTKEQSLNVPVLLEMDYAVDKMMDAILTEREMATIPSSLMPLSYFKYALSRKARHIFTGLFKDVEKKKSND